MDHNHKDNNTTTKHRRKPKSVQMKYNKFQMYDLKEAGPCVPHVPSLSNQAAASSGDPTSPDKSQEVLTSADVESASKGGQS